MSGNAVLGPNGDEVLMPPGTYRVGDPCYSVPTARWREWLTAANYMDEPTILLAELDGYPIIGIGTAYGDGRYVDAEGRTYAVDAGLIGLVPVGLPDLRDDRSGLWHQVTFTEPFRCYYNESTQTIHLGTITIPTGDTDDG